MTIKQLVIAIMHGRRHGFDYLGMITVVTDVVRENNQAYRLGWSEQCKDGYISKARAA